MRSNPRDYNETKQNEHVRTDVLDRQQKDDQRKRRRGYVGYMQTTESRWFGHDLQIKWLPTVTTVVPRRFFF